MTIAFKATKKPVTIDAICRLREVKRGNSKRDVGSVFKQLITGSK